MGRRERVRRNQHPRPAALPFVVLTAFAFFLAGYFLRATQTAWAQAPAATRSGYGDGNPAGHQLYPQNRTALVSAPASQIKKCLELVAKTPLAIRYKTAPPGVETLYRPPGFTCRDQGVGQPCVDFTWKDMTIEMLPSPSSGQVDPPAEPVDVYGSLSLDYTPN
jgi:hypothetical protein